MAENIQSNGWTLTAHVGERQSQVCLGPHGPGGWKMFIGPPEFQGPGLSENIHGSARVRTALADKRQPQDHLSPQSSRTVEDIHRHAWVLVIQTDERKPQEGLDSNDPGRWEIATGTPGSSQLWLAEYIHNLPRSSYLGQKRQAQACLCNQSSELADDIYRSAWVFTVQAGERQPQVYLGPHWPGR